MSSTINKPNFLQITDENRKEWIWPKQKGLNWACCDCGLTHRVNFRVVKITETLKEQKIEVMPKKYQVEFQMIGNDYMTDKVRKKEVKIYSR